MCPTTRITVLKLGRKRCARKVKLNGAQVLSPGPQTWSSPQVVSYSPYADGASCLASSRRGSERPARLGTAASAKLFRESVGVVLDPGGKSCMPMRMELAGTASWAGGGLPRPRPIEPIMARNATATAIEVNAAAFDRIRCKFGRRSVPAKLRRVTPTTLRKTRSDGPDVLNILRDDGGAERWHMRTCGYGCGTAQPCGAASRVVTGNLE